MSPERRAEVKARILAACKKAQAEGVPLVTKRFGLELDGHRWKLDRGNGCCALGAFVLVEQPVLPPGRDTGGPTLPEAAALGIFDDNVQDIAAGFDGETGPEFTSTWYDLGRELREELLGPAARGRAVTS